MDVSCQCGNITFKTPLSAPLSLNICHCLECRKQSASAFGTSATFPKFDFPPGLSCFSRPARAGKAMKCYFCPRCGSRLVHAVDGEQTVRIKGGCIDGLDWTKAIHIWCKRAVVPIPEGVERWEEDPDD